MASPGERGIRLGRIGPFGQKPGPRPGKDEEVPGPVAGHVGGLQHRTACRYAGLLRPRPNSAWRNRRLWRRLHAITPGCPSAGDRSRADSASDTASGNSCRRHHPSTATHTAGADHYNSGSRSFTADPATLSDRGYFAGRHPLSSEVTHSARRRVTVAKSYATFIRSLRGLGHSYNCL